MKLFQHRHRWEVIKTIWPYPEGYGTYCRGCHTVVDTGLSREDAERCAAELRINHAKKLS